MGEEAERGGVKISCLVSCNVSLGWQLVRKQGDGDRGGGEPHPGPLIGHWPHPRPLIGHWPASAPLIGWW